MLAFGCLLVLLGMFAIAYSVFFTVVSVVWLGCLLIIAGAIEAVHVVRHHERGHLILYLAEALLAIAAGGLMLRSPVAGALAITLVLAAYFVVIGIFRIVAAIMLRLPSRGWMLFNGILTLALGILVWAGWPGSGLWVLGLFIGISLIFSGWARIMLSLALRGGHFTPLPV